MSMIAGSQETGLWDNSPLKDRETHYKVAPKVGDILRARGTRITIVLSVLFLGSAVVQGQLKVLRVDPHQTDPAIKKVHGPHVVVYDPQVASRHQLFLFFVGTGGKAEGGLEIESAFAKWGYHAISLDYEDNVLTASLAHKGNKQIFGRYREAIVTGAPVSESIDVSPANSILNRFQELLVYLVKNDPDGGWGEFLANGKPVWSEIVVAGHSQGSGHAAYIGKLFKVDRVLVLSGPQDYLDNFDQPAPWLSRESATPPSRFLAFLNLNDPFNVRHQIASCEALMATSKPNILMVKPGEVIHGNYQILINDLTSPTHGSTLLPRFANVWEYMATTEIR